MLKKTYIALLLIVITLNSGMINFSIANIDNSEEIDITSPQAQTYSPAELFDGAVKILENRAINGWGIPSFSENESLIYYGLSGGIAGIGMNFLEALEKGTSWISSDMNTELLNDAESIAKYLISIAQINDTDAYWYINNMRHEIDLSMDFGLSGISLFFTKLYSLTDNETYLEIAGKTLSTIYTLSNHTIGLSWKFNNLYLYDNFWYPLSDMDIIDRENATYTGLALGNIGIAKAALLYAEQEPNNKTLPNLIINETLEFLSDLTVNNSGEISIAETMETPELFSTSYATGSAGFIDFYLDLYEYSGNETYLNYAIGLFNWINGTNSYKKYDYTWINMGDISIDKELGIYFGISGLIPPIIRLYDITNMTGMDTIISNMATNLVKYGIIDDFTFKFGERVLGGKIREIGSTSYYMGGGGVFSVINRVAQEFNIKSLTEIANKGKLYLTSITKSEGEYTAIMEFTTSELENAPLRGISATLLFLSDLTQGLLYLPTTDVDFGYKKIDTTTEYQLEVMNIGENSININWNGLSGIFSVIGSSATIEGGSSTYITIKFNPQNEINYNSSFIISVNNNDYEIELHGGGFDNPTITVIDAPEPNSMISSLSPVNFSLEITDNSGIAEAHVSVLKDNVTLLSKQMEENKGVYSFTWDVGKFANGTYNLVFTASDLLGHKSQLILQYNIGIYHEQIKDKLFSNTASNILIGLLIAGIIAAIFVTIKIRR